MRERLEAVLQEKVTDLLREVGDTGALPTITVEAPRQKDHGDFACNAAMVLAGRLKRSPREIAAELIERLGDADGLVARAEIAGPGFVNVWLAGGQWHDVLEQILAAGENYGSSDDGKGRKLQIEFVSANPTGPLSVGHGRQAILGDCVARLLLATGWDVVREYYFNNGGRQMRVLGDSVRSRYLEQLGRAAVPPEDALADAELPWPDAIDGLPLVFPRDGYQGGYIGDIAAALREREGEGWVDEPGDGGFREEAETRIFAEIRHTLDSLGIEFDVYASEAALYDAGKIEETLADLRETGLVDDEDGATWLRASQVGLERDRVIVKSSGEPTYLLPDLAYHREKFARGFEYVIDVQGADHKDQGPYVKAGVQALGHDPDRVEFLFHEFVTLSSGGEKVKQSTRKATFITIDELLSQVGPDVFRYFMIERRAQSHLDFDLDLATEKDWTKNPAFLLQYTHARTHGIERQALERGVAMPAPEDIDASRLELPEELELVKKLGEFPEMISRAAQSREPHHVAYYLRELAGLFNPYYQDKTRHEILTEDQGLTNARLGLTLAVRRVMFQGLELLGMSAPERM
jgi:arginyl-tRNA synthetase